MASFRKPEACGQTVLPGRSVLQRQKLVENAKIQKFKCDILSDFQTMCLWLKRIFSPFSYFSGYKRGMAQSLRHCRTDLLLWWFGLRIFWYIRITTLGKTEDNREISR